MCNPCHTVIVLAVFLSALGNLASAGGPIRRPNIVLVFIDDMGWGDFSCFGNTAVKTEI